MKYLIFLILFFSLKCFGVVDRRLNIVTSGNISHSISDELNISRGLYKGVSILHIFGHNTDVDSSGVPEDLWNGGGIYTGFPLGSPETIECFSSDNDDTTGGTGARTIELISILDGNYEPPLTPIILTMNGSTPTVTTGTFLRLSKVKVLTVGSTGINEGVITCRQTTTTSNVFIVMPILHGESVVSGFTVPAGKTAYVKQIHVSVRDTKSRLITGSLWQREFGGSIISTILFSALQSMPYTYSPLGGFKMSEKTDFIIRVNTTSGNNTNVAVSCDIVLFDNID